MPVERIVQFANGVSIFVAVNNEYVKFKFVVLLVPLMMSCVPVRLKPVIIGGVGDTGTTPAVILPLDARWFVQDRPGAEGKVTLLNDPAL